jgi:hypothetical protein
MQVSWASGDAYERYVGRWSRPVAAEFLRWLGVPYGLDWIDVGCGTGALTPPSSTPPRHGAYADTTCRRTTWRRRGNG